MMWIVHNTLGEHMWADRRPLDPRGKYVSDSTEISDASWDRRMAKAAACGATHVLFDLAEGLSYPSHPELWVKGAWDAQKMRDFVAKLRTMGLEAIPSLNFATCHDEWLGEYSRMVSTPKYYEVCRDLIRDVYEIFSPKIIHIGMDEEDVHHYPNLSCRVIRQGELYWHDVNFYVREVERLGARAMMAADKIWWEREAFVRHVPKTVLQQNWYYGLEFDLAKLKGMFRNYVDAYRWLDEAGYEQTPGTTTWVDAYDPSVMAKYAKDAPAQYENMPDTVRFAKANISAARLKGFVMSPWCGRAEAQDPIYLKSCENLAESKRIFEGLGG